SWRRPSERRRRASRRASRVWRVTACSAWRISVADGPESGSGLMVTQPPGKRWTTGAGASQAAVNRTVTAPASAVAFGSPPVLRSMANLAWASSPTDSPSRTTTGPACEDARRAADAAWEGGDRGDAGGRGDRLRHQPQLVDLAAGPAPAGDGCPTARIRARLGEREGQGDGRDQGEQDPQEQA